MVNKNNEDKKFLTKVRITIAICVIMIILLTGIDMVPANHRGVKVQFGKILGAMEPGIQWTGLFVSVHEYDMKIRKSVIKMENDFYAPDKTGQPIYAYIAVNYRVKRDSVVSLYKNVGKDKVIVDILNIHPIISEAFKQATVQYEALEILEKRQEVKELAKANIHRNFPEEYFEIVDIVISDIHFSEKFQQAIDDKKTALQLAEKAENDLQKVIFEQQQEIEKSKADAEKLRLQKAEITPLLIQKQWIEKWQGQLPLYWLTPPDGMDMMMILPEVSE